MSNILPMTPDATQDELYRICLDVFLERPDAPATDLMYLIAPDLIGIGVAREQALAVLEEMKFLNNDDAKIYRRVYDRWLLTFSQQNAGKVLTRRQRGLAHVNALGAVVDVHKAEEGARASFLISETIKARDHYARRWMTILWFFTFVAGILFGNMLAHYAAQLQH